MRGFRSFYKNSSFQSEKQRTGNQLPTTKGEVPRPGSLIARRQSEPFLV